MVSAEKSYEYQSICPLLQPSPTSLCSVPGAGVLCIWAVPEEQHSIVCSPPTTFPGIPSLWCFCKCLEKARNILGMYHNWHFFFLLFLWGIQIWMAEMTTVLFPTALLLLYCSTYCWTVYVVLLLCWLMFFSVKLRPFVFVASSTVHSLHSRHLLVLSLSKDVERLSYWCALNHVFYFNRAQLWSLGTRWKILCGTIINIHKYFQKWRQHI